MKSTYWGQPSPGALSPRAAWWSAASVDAVWLGVAFAGAVAASLVQGCGDSGVQCLGTPVACENRDVAQCIEGCRIREGCFGGSVSCDTLTGRPEVCVQATGCRYLGTCEGAEGCAALDFDEECPVTAGCVQVRRCDGAGFACESLEDSQCELYSQCELGSQCVGNARSCGDVGSASSCLDVPGCIPADTSPSVLD